jgi:hypothetical protein
MYDITTKSLVQEWGGWLNGFSWDYFSTITYKFDISPRRNESLMLELFNKGSSYPHDVLGYGVHDQRIPNP